MFEKPTGVELPDWWQRENQRRLARVLMFLVLLLALIGYFYYVSASGLTGIVSGVNFDTRNYIVFVRDDGHGHTDLYAIKQDGTGERRLTPASDTSNKAQPCWVNDGKSLIYAANLEDSHVTQIYLLGDGQPTRLTYGTGNKSCPVVSPDGKHAAFICQGAIKSVYLNGQEVTQLIPQPRSTNQSTDNSPAPTEFTGPFLSAGFSSDGTGMAGAQDLTDENSAALADKLGFSQAVACVPPGGGPTTLLSKGREVSFAWEKNGNRIACSFTELRAPNTPVDPSKQDLSYKAWLNARGDDATTTLVSGIQVFTFRGATPESSNLFTGKGYSIEPRNIAWSPDGTRMAFEGWRLTGDGQRDLSGIAVERLDTGGGVIVDENHLNLLPYIVETSAQGKPENPRWSPDSMHILFEMVRPDGKRDLWSINADGTNPINLTKGVGDNYDGDWSPAK